MTYFPTLWFLRPPERQWPPSFSPSRESEAVWTHYTPWPSPAKGRGTENKGAAALAVSCLFCSWGHGEAWKCFPLLKSHHKNLSLNYLRPTNSFVRSLNLKVFNHKATMGSTTLWWSCHMKLERCRRRKSTFWVAQGLCKWHHLSCHC